ncbi:MAG: sugar transferase [Candidatus Aminicenantes bacterium]|nr:sugar transferase [Candidatus Aminicenantes bacterium]
MIWVAPHGRRIAQFADGLTAVLSFGLAYLVWDSFRTLTSISNPIEISADIAWIILGFSLVEVALLTKQGAYSYQRFTSLRREIVLVAKTVLVAMAIFLTVHFVVRFGYVPRSYMLIFGGVNFLALSVEKATLVCAVNLIRRRGKERKKILVVGTGTRAQTFIATVDKHLGWGLEILGLLTGDPAKVGTTCCGRPVLGTNGAIERILHEYPAEEVIICVSTRRFDQIREILDVCEREGVQVRLNSDFFGRLAKKVRVDHIDGLPIISFITTPDDEWALGVKRWMDIVISGSLLILLSPLLLLIALAVKTTSKGPIFYRWNVLGLNKRPFRSWKFRTMIPNADEMKAELKGRNIMTGPVFKLAEDPRVTKVGRFLRKYSLDELPQLWSVLKGDMSLVGPRPVFPHELKGYESWHRRKLSIKPGITCLWQVSGRNEVRDFDAWVRLDLEYIDTWSLGLDLRILFKTVGAVLKGGGM